MDDAAKPDPALTPTLLKYALENPLKALSASVLSTGGLLLLVYFGRIRFMPDLSIESATSLLYATSLIGLFITIYIGMTMVMPGLILYWSRDFYKPAGIREIRCVVAGSIAIWLLISLWLFEIMSGWIVCSAAVLIALFVGWLCQKGVESAVRLKAWTWGSGVTAMFAFITSLPAIFFFLFGLTGDIRSGNEVQVAGPLGAFLISVMASAILVEAQVSKRDYRSIALIAFGLFILMLMLVGNFSGVAMLPVKLLGQGEIGTARIVVSSIGCKEINLALGENVCSAEGDSPAAICPVMLRSRIGSQVVLEFASIYASPKKVVGWASATKDEASAKEQSLLRRVVIDKSRLLSWQPLAAMREIVLSPAEAPARAPVAKWTTTGPGEGLDIHGKANPQVETLLQHLCGERTASAASAASAASKPD